MLRAGVGGGVGAGVGGVGAGVSGVGIGVGGMGAGFSGGVGAGAWRRCWWCGRHTQRSPYRYGNG